MKIGIFGGSFNPIHKGHINIAIYAIKYLSLDQLFFVPAYKSPFKKKKLLDADHRVAMIKLNLMKKMQILDFEIKQKKVSYTIKTIEFIKKKYSQAKIYTIIGSDQLKKLNKWKDIDKISHLSKIVVFKRENLFSNHNVKKYKCLLIDNQFYKESSTDFKKGNFNVLTNEVKKYIGKNYLYVNDILSSMLESDRYKHSIEAAKFAVKIAKSLNYDIKKAWVATIFHDVTKNWKTIQHIKFLEKYNIDGTKIVNYRLHSLTGSIWIDKIYQIQDNEIVNAINNHTVLSVNLTLLDKIVYAADKLCVGRNYNGIQFDRNLILKNFKIGFKNVVKKTYKHLKKNRPLTKEQETIYKKWI